MNSVLPPAPELEPKHLMRLYSIGEHELLSEALLGGLRYFAVMPCLSDEMVNTRVTPFLKIFFTLFTQADYVISERHVIPFILQNTLLSHLTAMSHFRTTDVFLEILRGQPQNFVKILTLYSARNTVHFERRKFFDAKVHAASLWYYQFCDLFKTGLVREDIVRHMTEHLHYQDERLLPGLGMAGPYFGSTYVDSDLDRSVKPHINRIIRTHNSFKVEGYPDPRKIAVITDFWSSEHSVYRNYSGYVNALKGHYHLTLFHIITPKDRLDTSMFDEVHQLSMPGGKLPMEQLSRNFQLVYFPDIGMTEPSMLLSNCRIAPIQICSPGHSASTWGADIDYFISGIDVEIQENPENNYSEQLVLLPGMGVIHNLPLYKRQNIQKNTSEIIINCPWAAHKTCARFIRMLRWIIDGARKPVCLRIFPNTGITQNNAYLSYVRDLREALGSSVNIDVRPFLPYGEYMQLMEEGDFTLDSFHFAGCNTIADSLFLHKPTLTLEGDKWYNRIGPAMLRRIGLHECICESEEEYVEKALLLIRSEDKRAQISAKIAAADLEGTLFDDHDAASFCRAVGAIIAHHDDWKMQDSKAPIVIR